MGARLDFTIMATFVAQPQRIPAAYYRTAAYPPPQARADVRDDYERTYGCLSLLFVPALTRTTCRLVHGNGSQ